MSRPLAGYIGYDAEPATTAAPGIWTLREAELYQRKAQWPAPTPTFVAPSDITGLQLWLDASDASTLYDATTGGSLVASDGAVARWEDKSGNARHATQSSSGSRPVRKASTQNGLDVIRGDGTNSFMLTADFSSDLVRSVFVVAVSQETPQGNTYACLLAQADSELGSGEVDPWLIGVSDVNTPGTCLRALIRNASDTAFVQNNIGTSLVTGDAFVASYINNGTGIFRLNAESAVFPTAGLHATQDKELALFAQAGAGGTGIGGVTERNHWDGDIAEILIYDTALSDTDREAVESYLTAKWGIS